MKIANRRLQIAFIHPDLGIGGAERLVLDAALYLQRAGHRVTIFTACHDPGHAFEATRDGALDIRSYPFPLPIHIAQRLRALCALARTAYLAVRLALSARYDVVFCDLIPHVIPLVRLLTGARVVYYCHYPDNYLAPPSKIKFFFQLYRRPIEWLEQAGIRAADRILVNSRFTAARLRRAYDSLASAAMEVAYPGVDPELYPELPGSDDGCVTLVSINRLVRFKNIGLAIEALAAARATLPPEVFRRVRLVLVGGYDARLAESRAVLAELKATVERLGVADHVVFRLSCSEAERLELLSTCRCFVYTPDEEHFGYGPVEAMAAGRPVIAVKSGGPMETVLDGTTGLLCESTVASFAAAMVKLILDPAEADRMGRAGRRRARERFSLAAFGRQLESILLDVSRG
ncbi:MAG TPA: glycosyltransferase, partial [Candidatus Binatia bacterium]|nr:glycosyltransferase [Candidatus Binatia bacterium]